MHFSLKDILKFSAWVVERAHPNWAVARSSLVYEESNHSAINWPSRSIYPNSKRPKNHAP
jgi:hypothetical protein